MQEVGLSLVYLVCFSWFASSCALGKTMASGSLQVQSRGILTRRVDKVYGVDAGYGRFIDRKFSSGGARGGAHGGGGERGGGSTATPRSGSSHVPGGAAVIPVIAGAGAGAAVNKAHQNSHQNGSTSYARNCLGYPMFILILLASLVVNWYI